MKYMLLIYHEEQGWDTLTEAERQKIYSEYGKFTQEIMASGHHLGGFELHPISTATSVRVRNGEQLATDGPFAETKELVAGFWMWKVKSKEEAIEWLKRCPNPHPGQDSEIEIRQVFEAEDFGAELTPELREQEERLRAQVANRK